MSEVYYKKRVRRDMHEFLRRTRQDIINDRIDPTMVTKITDHDDSATEKMTKDPTS
jgi:hypothetical protein